MKKLLFVLICTISYAAQTRITLAQTISYNDFAMQDCVKIANCILYGPGEAYSLWTTAPTASNLGWSIFTLFDWSSGTGVPTGTFNCNNNAYTKAPAGGTAIVLNASCSGTSTEGKAFTMSYTINAYSFYHRGGGGRGGGGAGTRWRVTAASVSLTVY